MAAPRGALLLLLTLLFALVCSAAPATDVLTVDVGVYGSTVCALAACVAAARMNASCAFVEPLAHVGGMTTGGLSSVDKRMAVGGIAREIYGNRTFPHSTPSAFNATLVALLAGAGPGGIHSRVAVGDARALVEHGARVPAHLLRLAGRLQRG